jgi:hypothetical protein
MINIDHCIIKEGSSFYIDTHGKEMIELGGIEIGDIIKFSYDKEKYIGKVENFNLEEDLFLLKNVIKL